LADEALGHFVLMKRCGVCLVRESNNVPLQTTKDLILPAVFPKIFYLPGQEVDVHSLRRNIFFLNINKKS
jgi:hypothetical protein